MILRGSKLKEVNDLFKNGEWRLLFFVRLAIELLNSWLASG